MAQYIYIYMVYHKGNVQISFKELQSTMRIHEPITFQALSHHKQKKRRGKKTCCLNRKHNQQNLIQAPFGSEACGSTHSLQTQLRTHFFPSFFDYLNHVHSFSSFFDCLKQLRT